VLLAWKEADHIQNEAQDKSIALVIRIGKADGRITVGLFKWAMQKYTKPVHFKDVVKQMVQDREKGEMER